MVMFQKNKQQDDEQVFYNNKWIEKKYFRAFVYNAKNEEKLANSYDEYQKLLATKEWFSTKEEVHKAKEEKVKNEEQDVPQQKVVKLRKAKDGNTDS